ILSGYGTCDLGGLVAVELWSSAGRWTNALDLTDENSKVALGPSRTMLAVSLRVTRSVGRRAEQRTDSSHARYRMVDKATAGGKRLLECVWRSGRPEVLSERAAMCPRQSTGRMGQREQLAAGLQGYKHRSHLRKIRRPITEVPIHACDQ